MVAVQARPTKTDSDLTDLVQQIPKPTELSTNLKELIALDFNKAVPTKGIFLGKINMSGGVDVICPDIAVETYLGPKMPQALEMPHICQKNGVFLAPSLMVPDKMSVFPTRNFKEGDIICSCTGGAWTEEDSPSQPFQIIVIHMHMYDWPELLYVLWLLQLGLHSQLKCLQCIYLFTMSCVLLFCVIFYLFGPWPWVVCNGGQGYVCGVWGHQDTNKWGRQPC